MHSVNQRRRLREAVYDAKSYDCCASVGVCDKRSSNYAYGVGVDSAGNGLLAVLGSSEYYYDVTVPRYFL